MKKRNISDNVVSNTKNLQNYVAFYERKCDER